MNAEIVPIKQTSFSLVPQNLREAMDLSKIIADSDLAPKDYRGKPGNVLIAVQMGQEVGLSPMAAIQSIAVINGKPSLYGDVGKAILLSRGFVIEEDDVEVVKKTGMGRCKITRPGHPPCERTFSLDAAKAAGLLGKQGPWTQYKERQMAWRAFWFAARDIAADLLKGLSGVEEALDITQYATVVDQTTGEVTPAPKPALEACSAEAFAAIREKYSPMIRSMEKAPADLIAWLSAKTILSEEQRFEIDSWKVEGVEAAEFSEAEPGSEG